MAIPTLELVGPLHTRLLAVLESYIDESYESQNPCRAFVVAGWLGEGSAWRDFEDRWGAVLKRTRPRVREFKTADCLAGAGAFRGWSQRKRSMLMHRLLHVVMDTPIYGVAGGILLEGPLRRNADYLTCLNYCLGWLTALAHGFRRGERVAYIIDERDKVAAEVEKVRRYMASASRKDAFIAARVGPLMFGNSSQIVPLQAADLLANTLYRDLMRRTFDNAKPTREAETLRAKVQHMSLARWNAKEGELYLHRDQRWVRLRPRRSRPTLASEPINRG